MVSLNNSIALTALGNKKLYGGIDIFSIRASKAQIENQQI